MADIFETDPEITPDQDMNRFLVDCDYRFAVYSTKLRQERNLDRGLRSRSSRVKSVAPTIGAGTLVAEFYGSESFRSSALPDVGPDAS